ncbi:MAG: efflux RND transporter periplasmic adaptor subunit, partial [Bacteroidota bacterium]|nr:efflux RND transporter periplasmic adaptor subunit [Bacteroidota bacterium]
KGSILLKVDDALLRADLEASEAAYRALKTDYERFSNVVDKGGVSTQQLDNIRTQLTAAHSRYLVSKRRFEDALVRAPISGIINDRYVEVGTYLNPGARLFDIMDETSLKLTVNVTERQVLQLKKGMAVRIGCRTFPGEIETGFISFIGQKADRSLSFPVEITLREKDKLKAGMFTTAYFDFPSSTKGVLIPRNAINGSIQQANVFLVRNGLAEKRPVVVGDIVGRDVEVLSGLQPGDSIVTAGLINVTAGIRVQNKQ